MYNKSIKKNIFYRLIIDSLYKHYRFTIKKIQIKPQESNKVQCFIKEYIIDVFILKVINSNKKSSDTQSDLFSIFTP